jgi:hypothetical protein
MNFYMKLHAEELRELFVSHEEQQRIEVFDEDWETIVDKYRSTLQDRLKADWLSEWISPNFSTTSPDDERTATILMMGIVQT